MALRAIVFDLDGTLVDSAPVIHAAGNAVLAQEGLPPVSLDMARGFIGNGARVFVERLEQAVAPQPDPARSARMLRHFVALYEGSHQDTAVFDGVAPALARLRAAGLRLALCTNKPHAPAMGLLAHLGWTGLFDLVVGGDTLAVMKPDPAPLLHVLAGLGVSRQQAVFVGDSDVDCETAQRAGVDFALFTRGYRHRPVAELPHVLAFDDWAALPEALMQRECARGPGS